MDQETFDEHRRELSGLDPLAKKIKLSDIVLDDASIEHSCIYIHGNRVPVSRAFFNRLGQAISLNLGLMNRMSKNEDKQIQIKLLEAVKAYVQRDNSKEFFLIGDPEKHQIIDIVRADRHKRLSNETMFTLADTLLNEIPDLGVESIDRTDQGMSINLVHSADHNFDRLGPDETFRFGCSLVNTPNNSRVDDFFYRLSCSNGAISRTPTGDGPKFGGGGSGGVTPDSFRDIINQATIWSQNGFVPVSFQDRLISATNTRASLAEMNRAFMAVENQIQEEDPDRKIWLVRAAKHNLFPALEAVEQRILSKGFNPTQLTDDQRRFIKTDQNIWQLVNDLTWIGSHDTTYGLSNNKRFKVEGGNLFVKKWDLEHANLAEI